MKNTWEKYRGINLRIGLIMSLGLMLFAFEWKNYDPVYLTNLTGESTPDEEWVLPPHVNTPPPPPPKVIIQPKLTIVDDLEEIEEVAIITEIDPIDAAPVIDEDPEPEEEEVAKDPPFWLMPEQHAVPQGGMNEFLKYIASEIDYPRQAKRMGVQGKVFLEFIIDQQGKITNIKVLRGIGAGCDEEAVRVLESAPVWLPAKQRGKMVKQKMTFPINFRLQ